MKKYPEYAEVNGKRYKINTDFRIAIKCNEIAEDKNIDDIERALGIICTLFGDEAVDDRKNHNKLLKIALKYLSCEKENEINRNEKPDMDYIEDEELIRSSFQYDYKFDPYNKKYVHWYRFFNDLNNLSNNEYGNCCVLNRVRAIRNYDLSKIKDNKERNKMAELQKRVALKKYQKGNNLTKEQIESVERIGKIIGIGRK